MARVQRPDLPKYPDLTAPGTDEVHDDLFCLYRAVVAAPHDDLPRLVFADRLQELDREEDADYIRTAIEFHRASVCNWCDSTGTVPNDNIVDGIGSEPCPFCPRGERGEWFKQATRDRKARWVWSEYLDRRLHPGGRPTAWEWQRGFPWKMTVDINVFVRGTFAGDLIRAAPIEVIHFRHTYSTPIQVLVQSRRVERWRWRRAGPNVGAYFQYEVPSVLFQRFATRRAGRHTTEVDSEGDRAEYRHFNSPTDALAALSEVAVDFARERAEMDPLPIPPTRVKRSE